MFNPQSSLVMKKLTIIVFVLSISLSAFAVGKGWMTNLESAMALSEETGKPILLEFSGSNWCSPCIQLNKNVFSKKTFLDFAKKNLILVLMDFPRPSNLSSKQKKYNNSVAAKYKIKFFPTVFLLDSKGKIIVKVNQRGDVKNYISFLKNKIPAKKAAKQHAFQHKKCGKQ